MILWTDYPLQESEWGKVAPIRRVHVLAYDRDKYARTYHPEFGFDLIKRGYLYKKKGRALSAKCINHNLLKRKVPDIDWSVDADQQFDVSKLKRQLHVPQQPESKEHD